MGRDVQLVNIYLKIHNKRPLTMDDLSYLAKYDPECFEKTCKNVVYNIPEAKPIMEPNTSESQNDKTNTEPSNKLSIKGILENLKRMEMNEFPVADIDINKVKNLLGDLFMELRFPHNDKDTFMDVETNEDSSIFDKKI